MTGSARWLGRMEYRAAWEIQKQTAEQVMQGAPDTLLIVEHPPVLTLGANFHAENLLLPVTEYEKRGIQVEQTDRGGDVTYHGPGQIVLYPIFDVARHGKDLHKWLRDLEETQLEVLRTFGIEGRRFAPHTGAWVDDRKVAAIGVKIRRWVSLHGIAMNCDADLKVFQWFVPCGISDFGVTSLSQLTGREVSVAETLPLQIAAFERVFSLDLHLAPA